MGAEPDTGRILVVEDHQNWGALLKCVLEEDGHQVVTVSTHAKAESELKRNMFDVVILDIRLVDEEKYNMQGMALLRRIKKRTPTTGAVILTGYPDSLHQERILNTYGADAYLSKAVVEGGVGESFESFDVESFGRLISNLVVRSHER